MSFVMKLPGKDGKPLNEAAEKDLSYWQERITTEQRTQPNGQYAERNRKMLDAIHAEFARRTRGGPVGPAPTALVKAPEVPLAALGALGDPAAVTAALQQLSEACHLISPATICGSLPEGCEIATSLVQVNGVIKPGETSNGEVYKTDGGGVALHRVALNRIAQAAGVTWLHEHCRRVDDRKDPRYVEYFAVGKWRLFDGVEHQEPASRSVDLRDESDEIAGMTEKQLKQARRWILENAEAKAKNRVIRALGLKPSYDVEELVRPFAVARFMFTGRTDDPELRRAFALQTQMNMQGAAGALFGAPRHALPAREPRPITVEAEEDWADLLQTGSGGPY